MPVMACSPVGQGAGQRSLEMLEWVMNELHLDPLVAAAIERGVRARYQEG